LNNIVRFNNGVTLLNNMNTNQTEGKATKICEHHKLTYCKNCYGYKCNKCGLSVFTCKLGGDE